MTDNYYQQQQINGRREELDKERLMNRLS